MDMIEKVARAIFAAEYDDAGYTMTTGEKAEYLRMARAAIEAMRRPTHEMVQASIYCKPKTVMAGGQLFQDINDQYEAMIDAALNPP